MKKLAVILAGGLSSRMGQEKSFLTVAKNKFLIDRVIESIAPQVDAIAINANHDAKRFAHTGLEILPDDNFMGGAVGPLIGVLTAMHWAKKNGGDMVLTVSCDCPQLPRDLYQKLAAKKNHDVVVAQSLGHHHPTIAWWRVGLAADLTAAIKNGTRKIDKFTQGYKMAVVDFTPPHDKKTNRASKHAINLADPFLNINTPEEFSAWMVRAM